MTKDDYKRTFSQIRPSDETIERIFEMSEKESKKMKHKGLIIAMACLMALLCGSLTANAATDGALYEGLQLIINGEDVDLKDYIKNYKSYTRDDGTQVAEYEFELPDTDGSTSIEIQGDLRDNEVIVQKDEFDDGTVNYEIRDN